MQKRLFTPSDYCDIVLLNSVKGSPDGAYVAVSITRRNLQTNDLYDTINLLSEGRMFGSFAGSSPQFAADGRYLAYENYGHIWIYDIETRQHRGLVATYSSDYFMGHLAEQNFCWSPASDHIAYVSTGPLPEQPASSQHATTRLLYKTKGGRGRNRFASDQPFHIWIIPLHGGEPRCLTRGPFNEHSISWSPDGERIAFISDRSGDQDRTHRNDLLTVNVHTGEVIPLVTGTGTRFKPQWSPDGSQIAFLADTSFLTSKDSPAPDTHLYVVDASGGQPKCLTGELDRRIDNIKWNNKSQSICFTAGDHGATGLYIVNTSQPVIKQLLQEPMLIKDYFVDEYNDHLIYISNSNNDPDELYARPLTASGKAEKGEIMITGASSRLGSFNEPARTRFQFVDAETFWFSSTDGTRVQGWLMKPVNLSAEIKYPMVLVMHGGPHNMFGYEFEERMQALVTAGYAVVYVNPRGSTGYGQDFAKGNLLNWGGKDYEDIMAGVDHVLENYSWIDRDCLALTGQSYGGFLTNWIITQTKMFKAAVSDGGISNLISFAGTSLYHCLIEAEFGGNTWDNYELLWRWSPLKYVKNVVTPTLFLHGETDNEVPVTQAEEMFSALKRLGIETMLVRYMAEGHGWRPDLLPANRIDLLERMIAWFDRHLKSS